MEQDGNIVKMEALTPETEYYPKELISFVTEEFNKKPSHRQDDVRVAAGEIIANAILYGNNRDPLKQIEIYCLWKEKVFYFAVKDQGSGIDINNPPFVPGRSGSAPDGGMGIEVTKMKTDLLYSQGSTVYCGVRI